MKLQKQQQLLNGQNSQARKYYPYVPLTEPWTSQAIGREITRALGTRVKIDSLEASLFSLVDVGLVKKNNDGFRRVAVDDPEPRPEKVVVPHKEVPDFPAPPPPVARVAPGSMETTERAAVRKPDMSVDKPAAFTEPKRVAEPRVHRSSVPPFVHTEPDLPELVPLEESQTPVPVQRQPRAPVEVVTPLPVAVAAPAVSRIHRPTLTTSRTVVMNQQPSTTATTTQELAKLAQKLKTVTTNFGNELKSISEELDIFVAILEDENSKAEAERAAFESVRNALGAFANFANINK